MSGVQSPPTPLIAAPRPPPPPPPPPPPRPPRPPPPGNPACAAPPPPPLRPPRPLFAGAFIAAEPAAPAAPTIPTTVAPNGDPGRRVNAKRFPSGDHVGAASRSTPGNA